MNTIDFSSNEVLNFEIPVTQAKEDLPKSEGIAPSVSMQMDKPLASQADTALPNPNGEQLHSGFSLMINNSLCYWAEGTEGYSSDEMSLLSKIAYSYANTMHTSTDENDALSLTTSDFATIVKTIRRLKKKTGFAELAVMILLDTVVEQELYRKLLYCTSSSRFFQRCEELMGISSSRARDYQQRGYAFLHYSEDILEGTGETEGIPLEELVSSHLTKLRLYPKAVTKFGRKEALRLFKASSFREFQHELKAAKLPKAQSSDSRSKNKPSHEEAGEASGSPVLSAAEDKYFRIIAKGGIPHMIVGLNPEQVETAQTRLREYHNQVLEKAYAWNEHESYNQDNPLEIEEGLYKLRDVAEIIRRIRSGLALVMPTRRTIAVLVYRLSYEANLRSKWQHPHEGRGYNSFKDFAMNELGMGEDYRDYVKVGRVLKNYYYFLNGMEDKDTEAVFLKLRYLEDALRTYNKNEILVRIRLQSLTVRQFKEFSVNPDFEQSFWKNPSKKQLELFSERFAPSIKGYEAIGKEVSFIEAYDSSEDQVLRISSDITDWEKRREEPDGVTGIDATNDQQLSTDDLLSVA
jgi:hypothetical protein